MLKLSIDKSETLIHWRPRWSFEKTVLETMKWYEHHRVGNDESIIDLMHKQINEYSEGS